MNRKTDKKGNAVSVLFTMLLFLVFVLCALFTVLIGSRVYENINVRSDANYTGNTALSYIANKVRQGDRAGMVNVVDVDGTQVLEMKQEIGESEYVTWIYWDNGSIRELFTDTSSGLGLGDSGMPGPGAFKGRKAAAYRDRGRGRRKPGAFPAERRT